MKIMTCKQMGGECDKDISAETSAEMARAMTNHVLGAHPKTAKMFQEMAPQEHEKWEEEFHKNWDAAPVVEA